MRSNLLARGWSSCVAYTGPERCVRRQLGLTPAVLPSFAYVRVRVRVRVRARVRARVRDKVREGQGSGSGSGSGSG